MSKYEEWGSNSFVTDIVSCQCLMGCNFEFYYYFSVWVLWICFLFMNNGSEIFFPEFSKMLDETQLVRVFLFIFLSPSPLSCVDT